MRTILRTMPSHEIEREHLAQVERCLEDGMLRLQRIRDMAKMAAERGIDTSMASASIRLIARSVDALSRTRLIVRATSDSPTRGLKHSRVDGPR